jgi:hypothetical protein
MDDGLWKPLCRHIAVDQADAMFTGVLSLMARLAFVTTHALAAVKADTGPGRGEDTGATRRVFPVVLHFLMRASNRKARAPGRSGRRVSGGRAGQRRDATDIAVIVTRRCGGHLSVGGFGGFSGRSEFWAAGRVTSSCARRSRAARLAVKDIAR